MSETEERPFALGTVLTITTGRLVAEDGIAAVYKILNYMTSDNLYTHQVPRASAECKPWLLRWHPELAEVRTWLLDRLVADVASGDTQIVGDIIAGRDKMEACRSWIAIERERLGLPAELPIERIPQDDHEHKDPYDELVVMRGGDGGIVVVVTDSN